MLLLPTNPFSLCCALLLCLPLALVFTSITTSSSCCLSGCRPLLTKHIVLPEDDEHLFSMASRVNPNPSPSNEPKRIAFMFLTTTHQPLPFAPLWELFFHGTSDSRDDSTRLFNIYIHADNQHDNETTPGGGSFTGVFKNRLIHSKPTQRFTPSLIAAARRLLSHALIDDSRNAMFALLSPSCIPLHSFNFTYTTLIDQDGDEAKSFIEILNDEPGAYDRWLARGPPEVMLPDVPFDDFRVGSQFFVLTRRHARLVVGDRRVWDKFNHPCVRQDVCYPEEHYFPTLLNMRDPRGCVPATLTHVDWTGQSDGHPRTYLPTEVGPELIFSLKRAVPRYGGGEVTSLGNYSHHHPFLFARKFSPDSLQPLLKIVNDVIFKD